MPPGLRYTLSSLADILVSGFMTYTIGMGCRREERLAMRDALSKAQERRRSLDGSMAWRGPASPPNPPLSAQFTS